MEKLTVIVKTENYAFQIDVRNSEIVDRYKQNPDGLIACIQGSISGAIGYLASPEEAKVALDLLEQEDAIRRLDIIQSLK